MGTFRALHWCYVTKTDVLVGQMTSTLFRTAISLRAAACDCVFPFASLDAPFCSDYGVRSGSVQTHHSTVLG